LQSCVKSSLFVNPVVATLVLQLTPLLPNYSSVLLPIFLPSKMFHHTPKISTFLIPFLLIFTTTYLYPPSIFFLPSILLFLYFSCPAGTHKPHVSFCPVSPLWPPLWNIRSADAEIPTGRKSCNHSSLLLSQQSTPKIF
ncbi:uncharacterized protein VICG_02215, partial [Vittaforma corneae ATCC 50505]